MTDASPQQELDRAASPRSRPSSLASLLSRALHCRFHISPTLATLLIGLVVVTGTITAASVYQGAKTLARERISRRLKDITILVANDIDPEEVARIKQKGQEKSPSFKRMHAELSQARVLAQKDGLRGVDYVYIVRRPAAPSSGALPSSSPENGSSPRYVMVVDGSPVQSKDFLAPGESMSTPPSTDALNRVWEAGDFVADEHPVRDPWGRWISGYLPLRRSDGSFESVLGIDIDASRVDLEAFKILGDLLQGLAQSMVIILPAVALFGRRLSRPLRQINDRHDMLTRLEFDKAMSLPRAIDAQWIQEIHAIDTSLRRMETALQAFSRYVPLDLARKLILEEGSLCMDGESRELAIMFSDIVGFTSLSENLPAKQTLALLNEYFTIFQETSSQTQGTLDKYIGDAALVFWGAPDAIANPARQCLEAALICQQRLQELNARWHETDVPVIFETCFGLHYGEVVVGNVGSLDRINYTIVGDHVNLCSRLEHQNRLYGTRILISRSMLDALGESSHDYLIVMVDHCQLRGFQRPIEVYEVRGRRQDACPGELVFVEKLGGVWKLRRDGRPDQALALLQDLPNEFTSLPYIQQLHQQLIQDSSTHASNVHASTMHCSDTDVAS